MKKLIYIFIFLLFINNAFAFENRIVKGNITCNKKGVAGVIVTDGKNMASTNSKGQFTLSIDENGEFVYYSLPSGYDTPIENGVPVFYKKIEPNITTYNFELTKAKQSQTKHTFAVWADPQIIEVDEFTLLDKVINDLNETKQSYKTPFHAISCGDMVFDRLSLFDNYKKALVKMNFPFYQVVGNHDMDYSNKTHETSTQTYRKQFGPDYYSFNKGNLHYIVLNDVFYYGHAYHYMGYLDQHPLNWLEKDLSYIPKGRTIVIALHIPTRYTDANEHPNLTQRQKNSLVNDNAFYEYLKGYNVHIMAGHSHTQWNTIINDSIMEHTHVAASAAWWQGEIGLDGTPKGYTVYEVDGDNITWFFKGVSLKKDFQLKSYPVGSDSENLDAFLVNVFNYDPMWKVEWYEDDKLTGNMEQYWGVDPLAKAIYQLGTNKKYSWLGYDKTNHIFKAIPKNNNAEIKVKVTDRFGNVYTQIIENR